MSTILGILAIVVGVATWAMFWLLMPWFTYSRAYLFIGGMIFVGASLTVGLAWRARGLEGFGQNARSHYLLMQGIGLFGVGIAWLFFSHYLLVAK